ncbi:serine/threonine-protein kinase pim-2-like [Salvelinus namaycush]|uniref:non-specific serine/threonine protein kinase n=1 Tax=Salvelinus namaycush TaxID=8040 RepID=A0A8U0P6N0_SALNM|nr:serine/threonine-protein kinase pim-2-like [Salvelinus namaycush]
MKGGAGFCKELERYRRLAFGPALGTRSMTRWRDTSVALKFVDQRKIKMWAKTVVSALLHCHSRGVVHRDLKPENILVQLTNHNVLLLDFGSASVLKEGEYTDVAGTPEYLPPETVLRGEYFAVPATVWSLGILLFQVQQLHDPSY